MKNSSTSVVAKNNNRKRFTKTASIFVASIGVVLVIAFTMVSQQKGALNLSSNTLLIGAALMTICLYIINWVYYKSMDEFEQLNFNQAGNLAFHTGFLAFPWFFLNELGIVPPLDATLLLFIMCIVFLIYYYGKKFL